MLYHDRGTVNIADVVRYTITYDPPLDTSKHGFLHHITSATHFHSKLHLRIRNNASILLRAAYLQGPYSLCVSVREDSFHANVESVNTTGPSAPVFDQDVRASTSFWVELAAEQKSLPISAISLTLCRRTWIIEIASQSIFASAPTTYTVTLGHTKDSTRKAAHANDLITSSPGVKIVKLTTEELWAPPPILPHHRNVHLVILTHGLHSNVTADMLYLKDCIEQTAGLAVRPDGGVVVRGYSGNVCKTERGIKWLGKRMARWLLRETLWLDQVGCFAPDAPYSRISFIGHSLGGVVQNFAIAMVELMTNGKFFRKLRPVHFITLASPWLGVSAENPAYVKLALDVGLIGRTGQDLGLMARLGQRLDNGADQKRIRDSRPILRLLALPTSPAHRIIRSFCGRTIYANVINDGIVPLRTSAMFFLDWQSFDTVQKSGSQNGTATNLSGIMGFPSFDNLFGNVEKIFSQRKSEPDGQKSSNEESSGWPQFPAFLRRMSTQAVHGRTPRAEKSRNEEYDRRLSLPSLRMNLFDVETEVAEAMGEDMSRTTSINIHSDAEVEHLRRQRWDEEQKESEHLMINTTTIQTSLPKGAAHSTKTDASSEADAQRLQSTILLTHEMHRYSQTLTERVDDGQVATNQIGKSTYSIKDISFTRQILQDNIVQSPEGSPPLVASPPETPHPISETIQPPRIQLPDQPGTGLSKKHEQAEGNQSDNPLLSLFQHFRPTGGHRPLQRKISKVYHRSQTIRRDSTSSSRDIRPPPPKTSFFESFPSLINPPVPGADFINKPSSRPKTIFHDRVYTPEDIPPVSVESSDNANIPTDEQSTKRDKLRLEEKIARDWHCDMTWRKVLVKLEPDAHNNIIVRRMFPNAYGWPVVEHLVREHFKKDPEGLASDFPQEVGIIPLGEESSPSWEGSLDAESDDELGNSSISEKPDSVGRALMSDEENGEIMEMTDFSASRGSKDHAESEAN